MSSNVVLLAAFSGCVVVVAALAVVLFVNNKNKPRGPDTPVKEVANPEVALQPVPVPGWAVMGKQVGSAARNHETNKAVVEKANRENRKLDFVMYGDSITAFHMDAKRVWTKYFGGLDATPLAMGGSTTDELAWRMMVGKEKLKVAPRVIAVMIGINDLKSARKDPAPNLEYIVRWMKWTWPTTKIYVLALLPCTYEISNGFNLATTNKKYRELAQRQGVEFLDCGGGIVASNVKHMADGLHPTELAQDMVVSCLKKGTGL